MELGLIKSDTVSGKLALILRNWSMRQSALTICPIDRMAHYLSTRDIPAESLSVVHHWADRNEIVPVEPSQNPLRRGWGSVENSSSVTRATSGARTSSRRCSMLRSGSGI